MAMTMSSGGGPSADINVTPLIDVLLVLIIIFMVITPLTPHGLSALVPQPPPKDQKQTVDPERTVVVQVLRPSPGAPVALKINETDITWDNLQNQLTDIYKSRAEKIMFIKGDDDLDFNSVAQVIDIAHAADPDIKVGLITAKIEAGQ